MKATRNYILVIVMALTSVSPLLADSVESARASFGNPDLSAKMEELAKREAELLKQLTPQQAPSSAKEPPAPIKEATIVEASSASSSSAQAVESSLPNPSDSTKSAKGSPADRNSSDLLLSIQNTNVSLTKRLKEKEDRVSILERELDQLRNRLLVAETERERISKQLDNSHYQNIVGNSAPKAQAATRPVSQQPAKSFVAPQPVAEPDLPIVTVTADKAALRTGPGMENSPLLHVSKGTTLTVETRSGNWYRVNTPQGTRAWISGDVVRFGKENSQIKNNAVFTTDEDRAYELLKSGSAR